MLVKACVNSGMCCKKAPCGFGKWNEDETQCYYLNFDENEISSCGKYEEIIKDPISSFYPAYGSGCCMGLFNERRDEIIAKHHGGKIPYVNIDMT